MNSSDEKNYVQQIKDGNVQAYSFLVDEYKNSAYQLAFRILRNQEDAEDASQDAFIKAYKSLHKFKMEASFSTWLYRIVYNTCLTKIKKRKPDLIDISDSTEAHLLNDMEQTFSKLVNSDRRKFLAKAMENLSEEQNSILHLFYTEEKDMAEIGHILNLTHGNVRVKLMRTRKKLLELLRGMLQNELKDFAL